jgi:hypothetical protein
VQFSENCTEKLPAFLGYFFHNLDKNVLGDLKKNSSGHRVHCMYMLMELLSLHRVTKCLQ